MHPAGEPLQERDPGVCMSVFGISFYIAGLGMLLELLVLILKSVRVTFAPIQSYRPFKLLRRRSASLFQRSIHTLAVKSYFPPPRPPHIWTRCFMQMPLGLQSQTPTGNQEILNTIMDYKILNSFLPSNSDLISSHTFLRTYSAKLISKT